MKRDPVKYVLLAMGGTMLVGASAFWKMEGFSWLKLSVACTGLAFVILACLGTRRTRVYRDFSIILLNTIVLLVLLEGGSSLIERELSRRDQQADEVTTTYYNTQSWGSGYLDDASRSADRNYEPYVIWKNVPIQGQYINVDENGNRATPNSNCSEGAFRVFMFGGSTMWGDGVPDWATIPSYFQTELSRLKHQPICVRNFGQRGWVSTQSVIELLRRLQAGETPNLVIFYDGFNEVGVGIQEGVAGNHEDSVAVKQRFGQISPLRQLLSESSARKLAARVTNSFSSATASNTPSNNDEKLGEQIVRTYLTNYNAVKGMSTQLGFDFVFFLQPNLIFGKKPITPEEEAILSSKQVDRNSFSNLQRFVYPQIESTKTLDRLFSLTEIFKDEHRWLYLDEAHLTPEGNEIVAKRMIEALQRSRQMETSSTGNDQSLNH